MNVGTIGHGIMDDDADGGDPMVLAHKGGRRRATRIEQTRRRRRRGGPRRDGQWIQTENRHYRTWNARDRGLVRT